MEEIKKLLERILTRTNQIIEIYDHMKSST